MSAVSSSPDPESREPDEAQPGPAAEDRLFEGPGRAQGDGGGAGAGGTRRPPWAWLAGAAGLIVVAGVAFLLLGGSDDAGAEVILEPTASKGADPFMASVAKTDVKVKGGGVKQVSGGSSSVESVTGSAPGLYGGTGKEKVCDAKAMLAFLKRNPDKAAAFAGVVGVSPAKLEEYVAKLTPVLLREDTRVTNHGFSGGQATSLQSVLQAGTAVMVDDHGVPRVRCACGNPLSEPEAVTTSPDFSGDRWEGFDGDRLVAVSASQRPVKNFTLTNVTTGRLYRTPSGQAGSGELSDLIFDFGGVGPLRIGMTQAQARAATGAAIAYRSDFGNGCASVTVPGVQNFGAIAADGKTLSYVQVYGGGPARTAEGIRMGSTKEDVERAYPGRVKSRPTFFNNPGELLVVEDGAGGALLLGTDGTGRVNLIRAGTPKSILIPEGCL